MTRIRTGGARAALLLALALTVAGCGSQGDDTDPAAEAVAEEDAQNERQAKFVECMSEHGVQVELSDGGGMKIVGRSAKDTVDDAMEACREYSPVREGASADPEAEERMRKMAQCMRDNGVEEFPDPEAGRGIQIGPEVGNDPDFEKAQAECDKYAPSGSRRSDGSDGNG
ncbi:hypothetical protein [Streptomyces sp. CB02400]|uniref:hypothetical protein n=1 Tax=Streptomyces sp. CB02400 TaxID=1703944 RepID=UPI0009398349|nr:hypothetical protein [Streptomyces sp. CB02400]OKK05425.1 hypothetical protein AMK33_21315 [Streptomyces sp. CB02400]